MARSGEDGRARSSGRRDPVPGFHLPPFSSLGWVDLQLVREWTTFDVEDDDDGNNGGGAKGGSAASSRWLRPEEETHARVNGGSDDPDNDLEDDDRAYDAARTLAPRSVLTVTCAVVDILALNNTSAYEGIYYPNDA